MTQGSLEKLDDGRAYLHFERFLPHPVDRVWAALTEPARLRQWLASADEWDLRVGGRVVLRWLNTDDEGNVAIARGTVAALDPPWELVLDTDLHGRLRWELEPAEEGTWVTLTTTVDLPREFESKVMAGWHVHLEFLADALDGRPIEDWENWPRDRWERVHEQYVS